MVGSPNNDLVADDDDDNPSVVGAMMAETGHPIIRINAQLDQLDIHRRSYINMVCLICFFIVLVRRYIPYINMISLL